MVGNHKELEDIKPLLILLLAKFGSSSEEIAIALRTDPSVVRKTFPMRKIKAIKLLSAE